MPNSKGNRWPTESPSDSPNIREVGKLNEDRYEKDLDNLINKGNLLKTALLQDSIKEIDYKGRHHPDCEAEEATQSLPSFRDHYQPWYSEAKALVRQLLPDRLSDFTRYYEKPRSRKEITFENLVIEDHLEGITVNIHVEGARKTIGATAVLLQFNQQLSIVKSAQDRFRSALFDIRQLAQADLFDSELDAAQELAKNKFTRAAGAIAGVILERHLKEICNNHQVTIRKRNPQISDLNDTLKAASVIETPLWRSIQYLGDLRNLCAHDKETEPTQDQINDLLAGVAKVTKTVF